MFGAEWFAIDRLSIDESRVDWLGLVSVAMNNIALDNWVNRSAHQSKEGWVAVHGNGGNAQISRRIRCQPKKSGGKRRGMDDPRAIAATWADRGRRLFSSWRLQAAANPCNFTLE